MPRPPPPAAALSSTGKPSSSAHRWASSSLRRGGLPGRTGRPAARAASLAATLSPHRRSTRAEGPMNVIPWASQISARSGFSERNP